MSENKSLDRLAAFSDGVFAIAITLLMLEIKVPPLHSVQNNYLALVIYLSAISLAICFPYPALRINIAMWPL